MHPKTSTRKIALILSPLLILSFWLSAQVSTNFNNNELIGKRGRFVKAYERQVDFEISAKNIKELIEKEKREDGTSQGEKPFRLAEPVTIDLDIAKGMNWIDDKDTAYGKFTIKANKALSTSINFDRFFLPTGTEMFVYNENGNMITGPVTENENNHNNIWGSWVYKGEYLTIELKTPVATKALLLLHSNNIAYGYKDVYKTEVLDFGVSANCNINVICPLGTGWEAETNSVALVLNDLGTSWCSGAMVMNTCSTNRPFFLTANHCYADNTNVAGWRFTFQAWSSTCPHPGTNSAGTTYNGSTLRANWAGTDFCLVELNNTPPANSNIRYAGWNRNTTGITETTIIHHPAGDVMKISRDNGAPVFSDFGGAQCWRLTLDQGATQGGTSGAPYFDQNHRIIAQHYGIDDAHLPVCDRVNKFGGRFDLSWAGGGTDATRLSNWLDPGNTAAMTTNTTNVSSLVLWGTYAIVGDDNFCTISNPYTVSGLPSGATVTWSASPAGIVSLSQSGNSVTVSRITNGVFSLNATVNNNTCPVTKIVRSGGTGWTQYIYGKQNLSCGESADYQVANNSSFTYNWSFPSDWTYIQGIASPVLYVQAGASSGNVDVTVFDGCDYFYSSVYVTVSCDYYYYSMSPNPASSTVIVSSKDKNAEGEKVNKSITVINIYDKLGILKKSYKFDKVKKATVDVSYLTPDVYVLEIVDGKNRERQQLSIAR